MKPRYLAIYAESTPGTFPGSPTAIPIRLIGDNAYDIRPIPQFHEMRSHETANRIYAMESTRYVLKGKLSTYLYPEQFETLLEWATVLDANYELASYAAQYFDGVDYYQTLGVYVEKLVLSMGAEQDEGLVKADLDLVAIKPGTAPNSGTFAQPAASTYPVTSPYKLFDTYGQFQLVNTGSTFRSRYKTLTISIENQLSPNFDENVYVSDITWHGRKIMIDGEIRYSSAADRTLFEAKTPVKSSVQWTKVVGATTYLSKIDLLTNDIITQWDRQQPLGAPSYAKIQVQSILDPASGTGNDITLTHTVTP
jgi:hypothetical protein